MSIFRVEKNTNYTVISNYHLRDRRLSLKTIGLLSLILSLPEEWDYSEAGLAAICKDGKDSISSGLKELEKYGYLERERERGEGGRICGMIYRVYEVPKEYKETSATNSSSHLSPKSGSPLMDSPRMENPPMDNPSMEEPRMDCPITDIPQLELPLTDKQAQINKESIITKQKNTDQSINLSNHSNTLIGGKNDGQAYEHCVSLIHEQIAYELLKFKYDVFNEKLEKDEITVEEYDDFIVEFDIKRIDQVVSYIADILLSQNQDPIKIGENLLSREMIKSKLRKVGMADIRKVVRELNVNPTIKNPKKYAIAMLYNA